MKSIIIGTLAIVLMGSAASASSWSQHNNEQPKVIANISDNHCVGIMNAGALSMLPNGYVIVDSSAKSITIYKQPTNSTWRFWCT